MKKIQLLVLFAMVVLLTGCEPETVVEYVQIEVPAECDATPGDNLVDTDNERIIPIKHINGFGTETDEELYVMFEYKTIHFTRYQVAFISCTCRDAAENFRQVMYIELNNSDASVRVISFDEVEIEGSTKTYLAGVWGDSSPIPEGEENTKEDFERDLINGYLIGKTPEELSHISTMDDMTDWEPVDSYVGNSVSVNNLVRAVQTLQNYQLNK